MGTDLFALIKYDGLSDRVYHFLSLLEQNSFLGALQKMNVTIPVQLHSYLETEEVRQYSEWHYVGGYTTETIASQHRLADLSKQLSLPIQIDLTFSEDSILVYSLYLYRWKGFLENQAIQERVLTTLTALCNGFGAVDCIITHDYSSLFGAFFDHIPFEEILKLGESVETLSSEAFLDKEVGKAYTPDYKTVDWPDNQPLPQGWKHVYLLNPRRYWRLPLPGRNT